MATNNHQNQTAPHGAHRAGGHPSFDPRNYGVAKLGELLRKQAFLEAKVVPLGDGSSQVQVYGRRKAGARS